MIDLKEPIRTKRSSVDRKLFCVCGENSREILIWRSSAVDEVIRLELESPCLLAGFSSESAERLRIRTLNA